MIQIINNDDEKTRLEGLLLKRVFLYRKGGTAMRPCRCRDPCK